MPLETWIPSSLNGGVAMFASLRAHAPATVTALDAKSRSIPTPTLRRTVAREADRILMLQSVLGNQTTRRLLSIHADGGRARDELRQRSGVSNTRGLSDGVDIKGDGESLTDGLDGGAIPGGVAEAKDAGGAGAPTTVTAASFSKVNATTTPAGMSERIPPRIDQSVAVTLTGSGSVQISVEGVSAANGTATVDGAVTKTLGGNGSVNVRGISQTAPGSAGQLRLVAKVGSATVGQSNAFTICAVPTTVTVAFANAITGTERGIAMTTYNNSDSGLVTDLDQVQMSEKVKYRGGTGCFAGITSGNNSGFLPADHSPHGTDSHGTPVALMTSPGTIDAGQVFVFNDARSGALNVIVKNSGFNIHRNVLNMGGLLMIITSKAGAGMTVGGSTASAGSGGGSLPQVV